ncbi:hypothetical protein IJG29_00595 [Candidatus Saccharibacteria bacterium]|nr:hypothetical protein [Candidatus Saccharibacteria bacterium]
MKILSYDYESQNGSNMAQKDLQQIIADTRVRYDSIGRVWCPVLNSYVHFTSEGRLHLIYKGNRKKRTVKEQIYKLNLFPLVIPVLKTSSEIESWRFRGESKNIQYYAISGEVGRKKSRIRVIIKRTGDGQFNYYSVMLEDNK